MRVRIQEKTREELSAKIASIHTDLIKVEYIESALREEFPADIKRFLWSSLVLIYEARKMYEKAGKAMYCKANIEFIFKDKVESFMRSGELYAKAGRVETAEEMFVMAARNANTLQRPRVSFTMKNVFLACAEESEKTHRRLNALAFYERLIRMPLEDIEKAKVKKKLVEIYNSLGKFREAKMVENISTQPTQYPEEMQPEKPKDDAESLLGEIELI